MRSRSLRSRRPLTVASGNPRRHRQHGHLCFEDRQRYRRSRSHPCGPVASLSPLLTCTLAHRQNMRAIVFDHPGDESVLHLGEAEAPPCGPGDVRIRVFTTAVNRADLLQRQGRYPPPPGASVILGLECAGEIIETCGSDVTGWHDGERVMALLAGGGYAEEVAVDAGSVMRLPAIVLLGPGGAFPETFLSPHS